MKSLFEEFGGTYTLGKDGMYYPNLMIEETDQRSIGKWGRMHREYLKEQHPRLYQRLILNGTMGRHLAYADGRATAMLESLITQMVPGKSLLLLALKVSLTHEEFISCVFFSHPSNSHCYCILKKLPGYLNDAHRF